MREIHYKDIVSNVAKLCIDACCIQTDDIKNAFNKAKDNESSPLGKSILEKLIENGKIAEKTFVPICQDTGMAVIFVELGQDVRIVGGYLEDAINEGVKGGYVGGYLRKSVVEEPLFERKNTTNNTPAVIHTRIVKGDKLNIKMAAKGFGSENKSILKMLVPADGIEGVKKVFTEAINLAGPNACPPLVVGVGIGGTMEKAAILAKMAAVREIGSHNQDERYAKQILLRENYFFLNGYRHLF